MDIVDTKQSYDLQYASIRYKQYVDMIKYKLKNQQKPHDRRYKQGFFIPTRPLKNMNIMETEEPTPIVYRSGWEKTVMEWMDQTPSVIRWGSEIVKILYKNPIKNKMSFYEPDIYVEYISSDKKIKKMLIEIKPLSQTVLKETSNGYDKIQWAINQMKWAAAIEYCNKRDIEFKIMHENNLGILK